MTGGEVHAKSDGRSEYLDLFAGEVRKDCRCGGSHAGEIVGVEEEEVGVVQTFNIEVKNHGFYVLPSDEAFLDSSKTLPHYALKAPAKSYCRGFTCRSIR